MLHQRCHGSGFHFGTNYKNNSIVFASVSVSVAVCANVRMRPWVMIKQCEFTDVFFASLYV